MLKKTHWFWLVAFVIAWFTDFLFWGKPAGISFLIWTAVLLAGGFTLTYVEAVRPARRSVLLAALLLAASGLTLLRSAPLPRLVNTLVVLAGLLLLVRTFRSGGWTHYGLGGYLLSGLEGVFFGLSRALSLPLSPPKEAGGRRAAVRRAMPVLRGVLLALPVLFLFASLLASADLVFAGELDKLVNAFALERWPEYFARFFFILALTYVLAGLYAQAVQPNKWTVRLAGDASVSAPEDSDAAAAGSTDLTRKGEILGATESLIILGSVDLLFVTFVAIQFRYLFGGQTNINAAGFTYSEYARRGFFELVTVAVFALLLYLLLNAITRRSSSGARRSFTILSSLLLISVLVILVSAFQRLQLYEQAYGFTRQRVYTHVFIFWLGVLLLGTIGLQWMRRSQVWGAILALVVFGFAATLGLVNLDGQIARLNIERAVAGEELDPLYLVQLSDDALPVLVQAYRSPEVSQAQRDQIGAVLACRSQAIAAEGQRPWQSYHPAQSAARAGLASVNLHAYVISNDNEVYLENQRLLDCTIPEVID